MQNREIRVDYDKIKNMASEQGLSICRLEKQSGLKNGTVRKWESVFPNIKSLFMVAETLNVNFWELTEIK